MKPSTLKSGFNRRRLLRLTACSGIAGMLSPRVKLFGSDAPSDKLNIALVALGGRGAVHARELRDQNIVAVCDVDWRALKDSPGRKALSVPLGVTPHVCAIDMLPEVPRAKRYERQAGSRERPSAMAGC